MQDSYLIDALERIRTARNNMSKEVFLRIVFLATEDANVAIPLMEAASVCSMKRIMINSEKLEEEK